MTFLFVSLNGLCICSTGFPKVQSLRTLTLGSPQVQFGGATLLARKGSGVADSSPPPKRRGNGSPVSLRLSDLVEERKFPFFLRLEQIFDPLVEKVG